MEVRNKKTKRVAARVPVELLNKIQALATKNKTTLTEIIIAALVLLEKQES